MDSAQPVTLSPAASDRSPCCSSACLLGFTPPCPALSCVSHSRSCSRDAANRDQCCKLPPPSPCNWSNGLKMIDAVGSLSCLFGFAGMRMGFNSSAHQMLSGPCEWLHPGEEINPMMSSLQPSRTWIRSNRNTQAEKKLSLKHQCYCFSGKYLYNSSWVTHICSYGIYFHEWNYEYVKKKKKNSNSFHVLSSNVIET